MSVRHFSGTSIVLCDSAQLQKCKICRKRLPLRPYVEVGLRRLLVEHENCGKAKWQMGKMERVRHVVGYILSISKELDVCSYWERETGTRFVKQINA